MEFESADLGEASYFSHPSFFTDLTTIPPAASSPARSVLRSSSRVHSSRRFLAFTLSLSLPLSSAVIGYTSAEGSGESGQIEMLYYLNSVATTVRDLLVDIAPDSPL